MERRCVKEMGSDLIIRDGNWGKCHEIPTRADTTRRHRIPVLGFVSLLTPFRFLEPNSKE